MNRHLLEKIERYKAQNSTDSWSEKVISEECRRLENKLQVQRIEPKEYRMLRKIAEGLKIGEDIDLVAIARWAGFPDWKATRPETAILRNIDNKLFDEIVGINRKEIQMELLKVLRQDGNLAAKNKAIELAARITGMSEPEKGLQINIVNDGITVAD